MKIQHLWPFLNVTISLLAGATSCAAAQVPPPQGIHFTASVDQASVAGGLPIWLNVSVVNATGADITLPSYGAGQSLLDSDMEYQVTRRSAPGEVIRLSPDVAMTTFGREQLLPLTAKIAQSAHKFTPQELLLLSLSGGSYFGPLHLKPGRSYQTRIFLSRLYDMTEPGKYTVQVTYRRAKDGDRTLVLTTPPLTVTVQ